MFCLNTICIVGYGQVVINKDEILVAGFAFDPRKDPTISRAELDIIDRAVWLLEQAEYDTKGGD